MTIRRDVEMLSRQGTILKTVGGAQRLQAPLSLRETAVYSRLKVNRAEKRAIALRALELVTPHATIFIDGSTTCLELARGIAKEKNGLTIVTNSLLACLELGKSGANTIIGIGGQYDSNSLCHVGPKAEDYANELFLDIAFVGTKALLPSEGTFESSVPTIRIKQIVARRCTRLVLLVDHSKIGHRSLVKVLNINQIHTIVTDDQVQPETRALLSSAGRELCIATRPALESAMTA